MTSLQGCSVKPPPRVITLLVLVFAATLLGVVGQVQVFQVRPENVQVRAGDDVFLKCVVENQQGNAQWTKDGFALGFERGVPGYPRYQYAGDASQGEHHLVIKGITLEDDGEYQCQVGPTQSSLPIWSAANVTVMVSPSSIAMIGRSEGEMVEVKAASSLVLECIVSDSRPPPTITWYNNKKRIEPKHQTDAIKPSKKRRLMTVVSRLELTAQQEDDGVEYSCRAKHPALRNTANPLTASVTLSVLHPPGRPMIHGYKTGEVLRAGERRTLTCRVVGGNPHPWVTWYWHGHPNNHTVKGKTRKSVYLKAKASPRNNKKSRVVTVVQQVTASRTEDGAVYECRVSSDLLPRLLSTNVTLTVHYAPTQVRVSGTAVVAAGQAFTLTCVTTPANPPATITWTVDGTPVNTTSTEVTRDDGGGWITSSQLTQEATRSRQTRETTVKCEAHHLEAGDPISHTRDVTIIRPPGLPVVEVVTQGQIVAGRSFEVTCTSKGGHPPPQFRLYKREEELIAETQTRGDVSLARASVRVVPADNGGVVRCEVINPASSSPLTANTTLTIIFPAWEVVGVMTPESVEAGQVAKLTCETSSSVPPSTVTWHSGPHTLDDPSVRHSPGLFRGTITRSEVKMRLEAEDNARTVTCEANNGLGVTVTTNITLNILHGPVWLRVPNGRMDVLEGDELTITAKAAANPGPVTYSWWRGSEEVGGKEGKDGELKLGVLRRQQTHNYTVTAHSPRGTLTSAFFLNVLYGPEDLMTKEQVVVENGGSTTILCSAVGNPSPNITWSRNADNTSSVLAWGIGEARLVMELASRGDTGTYYCYAFSTVASIPPVSSTLIVQQAPWWRNDIPDEVLGGSWAAVGGSGRVECRVRAAPPPTFHWATQDGREITSGHKYTVEKPQLSDGVVEWRSVLEVRGVTARDYTHYTCTATNPLGKHSSLLALTPPLPPATPLHLTVGNVTSGQVWLYWKPNLSRSVPSGYIVRYWKTGDTEYQFVNVSGGERTAAVVEELAGGTKYSLTLQAYNLQGRSPHTSPPLTAVTLGVAESASSSTDGDGRSRVPRLILLIMTLAGTALLALNMAIIACFVRRRAAHNTRGVSASSSKTTTLEVFSPATTPGGTTQGDELPLTTTTTTDLTSTLGGQRIECQTTTNDSEQTSLFRGEVGGTPVLSPVDDLLSNTNFKGRTRSQQNGRVLTQNGGHNVQKYRDDSSYYYSPIPQNSSISGDDGATRLTGNPPDVCPTTSDSRGTLIRRHQQPQQRGTTATCPTELPEGPVTQHVTAHTHQPFHSSSTNKENVSRQSPGDKCHEHHPNNHHQQQIQKRSSPRGVERQEAPSQQEQQLDPYSYPHFDVAATATGVPGGYATVGSRKHRHTAATFSTLQRPGTSRPHSIPVGTAQQTPPGLQKATLPQGRHSRQQPHQDSTGHQQLSRAGGGGGSSTGAGQDDSGSSGYGGSPHQEMSVPSSVGTTTVTLGESGSLLPHMAAVISLPPNTSSTTLSRPRPSSQDGARKTKPELSMLLTRDPHSGGVNK